MTDTTTTGRARVLDCTEAEYRAHPNIANSDINTFLKSPMAFYKRKVLGETDDRPPSDGLRFGSAFDLLILEPERFREECALIPEGLPSLSDNERTCLEVYFAGGITAADAYRACFANVKKEDTASRKLEELREKAAPLLRFEADAEGKLLYSQSEYELMLELKGRIQVHPTANSLLWNDNVVRQAKITHELRGLPVKGMVDAYAFNGEKLSVVDLKTTAKPLSRYHEIFEAYGYHRQMAMYGTLASNVIGLGEVVTIESYHVVASKSDREVGVFRIPDQLILKGMQELRETTTQIQWHYNSGQWEYPAETYEYGYRTLQMKP